MNFFEFQNIMSPFRVFSIRDVDMAIPGFLRLNLHNWMKKGYINKIRNGWYYFPSYAKSANLAWLSANLVYAPSYVSLQSAFSYYNLIPEGIFATTSVTTNHTKEFNTPFGRLSYNNIKRQAYGFGHTLINVKPADPLNSRRIVIAELEKAILDFFYLYPYYNTEKDIIDLRFDEYVLNEDLDEKQLDSYLEKYQNHQLEKRIELIKYIYL